MAAHAPPAPVWGERGVSPGTQQHPLPQTSPEPRGARPRPRSPELTPAPGTTSPSLGPPASPQPCPHPTGRGSQHSPPGPECPPCPPCPPLTVGAEGGAEAAGAQRVPARPARVVPGAPVGPVAAHGVSLPEGQGHGDTGHGGVGDRAGTPRVRTGGTETGLGHPEWAPGTGDRAGDRVGQGAVGPGRCRGSPPAGPLPWGG